MMGLLNHITPINLQAEELKYFKSTNYHPQFRYAWEKRGQEILKGPSLLYQAIYKQNYQGITKEAQRIFKTSIDDNALSYARDILKTKPRVLNLQNEMKIVKAFSKAFEYFGLAYRIKFVDKHGFNFRPKSARKIIEISKYANLQFFSIDGEVKHEMVHILRYENGIFNGIKKSINYLPTEEGLASFMQDFQSSGDNYSLFQHAAEYEATQIGIKTSLRDVINYFISIGFPKRLAWQRGVRHKFGFIDTSKPGDIMKPAMYFYNECKIKNLSNSDKLKLFAGKISIDDLNSIKKYTGFIPMEKIVKFYNLF